jgi:hypothetical protein
LDKRLQAHFDLWHEHHTRQQRKAKECELKKKQIRGAMQQQKALKHPAARQSKLSAE